VSGHFLIEDGKLIEMSVTPYDAEDHLQALLADHPQLLAGDWPAPSTGSR